MATTTTPSSSIVHGQDGGEALWGFGGLMLVKAPGRGREGEYTLVEQRFRRHAATPLHVHPDDFEAFHVLEGRMVFHVDGRDDVEGGPGTFVHVPAGLVHAWGVLSEHARFLVISTAQHEQFIRAASIPAQGIELPEPAPMDLEQIAPAAERYGTVLLAPPPFAFAA